MKIHLQSDMHIEFGGVPEQSAVADVYVCAGDIGLLSHPADLDEYFDGIKDNCDHIIWVLGNHEFYHGVYEDVLGMARDLAKNHGVHLLDIELGTQDLEIDGVKFWGTTFWTDLHKHDWFAHKKIQDGLNDFHVIKHKNHYRNFSAHESYEINKKSRELINWDADVIITHHCPIDIEHPKFPRSEITYAFVNTGLEEQIIDSDVKYWLYGHTHHSTVSDVYGTLVVSNQRGYDKGATSYGWAEECGFDPNLILEI